mgnify:CR=1 FL=1
MNATFAGIPSIKLPPSGKKVSLATRVSARIKRTDSIVQKGESGIGMDTVIFQDSAPYLYKCDRQQCRLVPDIFLARQCCPSYQAFQQTWYCAPTLVQSAKSTNPTTPIIQHFFIFFPSYILATNSRKRMVMTAAA